MTARHPPPPRKQPRQGRSMVTVQAILDATAHILVSDGYAALNTNRVAERAGVSIGSLYQYFPNKAALIAAVRQRHADQTRQQLIALALTAADLPLRQAVPRLIDAVMAAHRIDPRLHQVLEKEVPRQFQSWDVTEDEIELRTLLQSLLQRHRDQVIVPDLTLASLVLVRMVDALVHLPLIEDPMGVPAAQVEQEISTVVLRYLTGQP
ncbi:MAG: TetR/AcrR family transcriptional regulator [Acidobacteriota bacterium]